MSRILLLIAIGLLLVTHFCYYPKWQESRTEATISWDVSGYYMYLPAAFIYKDLKQCNFKDDMIANYEPAPNFQQAFIHTESGNYVMKYSLGQALQFSPFFFAAHLWASNSPEYPADGFSFPYQLMISLGSLLIAILGLIFLRKSLLQYFEELPTGLTLIGLVLGSNYLNYTAIDGAMTHNNLFTIYSLLIYLSIAYYKQPSLLKSLGIGGLVGLAALTRPTELLAVIIPICWGINLLDKEAVLQRFQFFIQHKWQLLAAVILCGFIGSFQLMYWKYASGDWIVYSYEDQGFSWLRPHLREGLFSYKSGWLTYSPFMIFALWGFYPLFKKHRNTFSTTLLFSALFIYIAFAWDIWWYGGSLGQRTMVQAYPILAFPLAAFFGYYLRLSTLLKGAIGGLILFFSYVNIWFTHQAHKGALLHVGQMRKAYYWKTFLTYQKNPEDLKLLDGVDEIYTSDRGNIRKIYQDSSLQIQLTKEEQRSEGIVISFPEEAQNFEWIRVNADCEIGAKEWNFWTMTQFFVELRQDEKVIEKGMIRLQRHLDDQQRKIIFLDLPKPTETITDVRIQFWNAGGDKAIHIKGIEVETYDEAL